MKFVKLESVSSDIDYGLTESATDKDTGHKFLRITDIRKGDVNWNNVPFCECSESDSEKYELHNGDIVFARTGSVGNTGLINKVPEGAVFASYLIRIRPNQNNLDPLYLSYFFQTQNYWNQIEAGAVGAIQGGVNASKLKELDIPLLPLPEQHRIAGLLARADRLRRLRRVGDDLSGSLLQSVFLEMFGDPIINPKRWDVYYLADLCVPNNGIKAGPFGSSLKKEIYTKSGYRIYGQEQVIGGSFAIGDYYISKEMFEKDFKAYEVKPNDVLISLVGTFGKTIIVPDGIVPGIINPRLVKISPRKEKLNSVYLAQYLQLSSVQKQFLDLSHGGTMGILNAGQLKEFKIICPPLPEQESFARVVRRVEALRRRQAESARQGEGLFQGLLAKSFGN
jgi:type I restriction enzyme, S subunit